MSEERFHLPPLARAGHASHCKRCLSGLPGSQSEVDASKLALSFYCIGSLDLLGAMDTTSQTDRQSWKDWIWEQQTKGRHGSGFRPSSFMTPRPGLGSSETYTEYDTPHIIMTYTALLCLSILRDDFLKLDRAGIINFMRACQRDDGSFSIVPGSNETDLRTLYCAFAISHMLNDWSGVDTTRAAAFIASCRTYEGGYGQAPFCEAQGGTTYIAIASLHLAPQLQKPPLTLVERQSTIHWLLQNQDQSGGFCGRTGKDADACYCFWCGATLEILDAKHLIDANSLVRFLASCQFKYGGISKAPGETPDPYHTYLSLAALAMYPPGQDVAHNEAASWRIEPIDPLLNATKETVKWAREHIPA
ncbi:terpenoid cyclases/protein prenyltransferase alpha-alpha toroid [Collybia nuda]|uniref:Geranylgeranyl transferase type-1 subunit beta n=1 Tax=Collybia nuda TaxID=64659 RepID=A0A9P5Y8R1_9AGAR|nr:terpenoid cyclases/protein prenyltransferase alpha-alpha toroid [Collybia nuda]